MHVVPAGVHDAAVAGGEVQAGRLLDRQRVDVAPDRHRAAFLPAADPSHDSGSHHPPDIGSSERFQLGLQPGRGPFLFPGQLRIAVQVAPERGQPGGRFVAEAELRRQAQSLSRVSR